MSRNRIVLVVLIVGWLLSAISFALGPKDPFSAIISAAIWLHSGVLLVGLVAFEKIRDERLLSWVLFGQWAISFGVMWLGAFKMTD